MPRISVVFYQDEASRVPVLTWLRELRQSNRRAFTKCVTRIRRLAEMGYELRRPEADYLQEGIYELRARQGHVNYRILYFFHGQTAAILAHALVKEGRVPEEDIHRALQRKAAFEQNPERYSAEEEIPNG